MTYSTGTAESSFLSVFLTSARFSILDTALNNPPANPDGFVGAFLCYIIHFIKRKCQISFGSFVLLLKAFSNMKPE